MTLLAFEDTRSVVQCAQRRGMTQAAVSQQLARLEKGFDVPLFEMRGRKKMLTDRAIELCRRVRPLYERLNLEFGAAVSTVAAGEASIPLRVGCRSELFDLALTVAPEGRALRLIPLESDAVATAFAEDRIDAAIAHSAPSLTTLKARKLGVSNTLLVVHPRVLRGVGLKALDSKEAVAQLICKVPALAYRPVSAQIERVDPFLPQLLEGLGVAPAQVRTALTCPDWRTLVRAVHQERGFAVVPDRYVSGARAAELTRWVVPAQVIKPRQFWWIELKT